jgi:adenylosuccinate synthase
VKNVDVVIGANYGDEGKGHIVDYLAAGKRGAVVRFNGGAQAAHTVEAEGRRHVFHHLGSGTLAGAVTVLSRFFIVNPLVFAEEMMALGDMRVRVFADPRAVVTTPYEVDLNRKRNKLTGHGTCGIGIGETMYRENAGFSFTVADLQKGEVHVREKLNDIRDNYYEPSLTALGFEPPPFHFSITHWMAVASYFINVVTVIPDTGVINSFDNVIFEGAQGLRLDQYSKDFPHVTYSNTGLENVAKILEGVCGQRELRVYYVTRSYLTRHGTGPLDNEIENPGIVDKTNLENPFQGPLRFASDLDLERMATDIANDKKYLNEPAIYGAAITWLDKLELFEKRNQMSFMSDILSVMDAGNLIGSYGPDRSDIHESANI